MRSAALPRQRTLAVVLATLLAAALSVMFGAVGTGHEAHAAESGANSAAGDPHGTTEGWLNGQTVKFIYPKSYYCDTTVSAGSASGCELGAPYNTPPRPGANIPDLYAIVPLGFSPAGLQCPVAGSCINHPSDIDVSRVFGPGTEKFALPAHSHIITEKAGGWWDLQVIGVTSQRAYDEIAAGKSYAAVEQARKDFPGEVTGEIPTNSDLFFNVAS